MPHVCPLSFESFVVQEFGKTGGTGGPELLDGDEDEDDVPDDCDDCDEALLDDVPDELLLVAARTEKQPEYISVGCDTA